VTSKVTVLTARSFLPMVVDPPLWLVQSAAPQSMACTVTARRYPDDTFR
jgi:hypothetical protein